MRSVDVLLFYLSCLCRGKESCMKAWELGIYTCTCPTAHLVGTCLCDDAVLAFCQLNLLGSEHDGLMLCSHRTNYFTCRAGIRRCANAAANERVGNKQGSQRERWETREFGASRRQTGLKCGARQ
ncbi:hypothetical protein B0J14DRAFT_146637 [Halenospora varia]|nr:hypothetical protein B0J14DRAFT_146637 [Halenospora varia]